MSLDYITPRYMLNTSLGDRIPRQVILSHEQAQELIKHRDSINPAELSRDINRLQCILTGLAKEKTERLIEEAEETKRLRLNKQQRGVRVVM